MSKEKMFVRGQKIKSLDTLWKKLERDRWVIMEFSNGKRKPMHEEWIISLQLRTVLLFLKRGRIFVAKRFYGGMKQIENEFFSNGKHFDEYEPDDWQYQQP